jgi:hypothetical protein
MVQLSVVRSERQRANSAWRAVDDFGRVWSYSNPIELYRRVMLRNELLRNIAATSRPTATRP